MNDLVINKTTELEIPAEVETLLAKINLGDGDVTFTQTAEDLGTETEETSIPM